MCVSVCVCVCVCVCVPPYDAVLFVSVSVSVFVSVSVSVSVSMPLPVPVSVPVSGLQYFEWRASDEEVAKLTRLADLGSDSGTKSYYIHIFRFHIIYCASYEIHLAGLGFAKVKRPNPKKSGDSRGESKILGCVYIDLGSDRIKNVYVICTTLSFVILCAICNMYCIATSASNMQRIKCIRNMCNMQHGMYMEYVI